MHVIDLAIFDQPQFAEARRGGTADIFIVGGSRNHKASRPVHGFWSWLLGLFA